MKAVTEAYLREAFRKTPFTSFTLAEGQLLTPSAAQYLREKKVELRKEEAGGSGVSSGTSSSVSSAESEQVDIEKLAEEVSKHDYIAADGTVYQKKPEFMTHLHGNRLVGKDHPRIALRGELDSFQSAVLLVANEAAECGQTVLATDLDDILQRARAILKAEVLERELEEQNIIGLDRAALREQSHHPRKYYDSGHITPRYDMDRLLLAVNDLRSRVRVVELAAVRAFRKEFEVQRVDIIEALNAMSSALYIIMIRQKSAWYTTKKSNE